MKNHRTPPAQMRGFITTLPFRSQANDDAEANYDVTVWRAPENECEMQDDGQCNTAVGVYYGSAEDDVTRFCPRHFYQMHFGPDAPYRFVDPKEGKGAAPHNPEQTDE